jgi:protein involved in polysaccharide export with SLBB domain
LFALLYVFASPSVVPAVPKTLPSKPSPPADGPLHGSTPNPGYRLGANDVIRVQVFGEDALSTETRVSGDGKIALPLLGVLEIQGLTVKQTEALITERLADGYLKHPQVSIYITRYRNFYVSGQVKAPGGYPFEEGLTVLKAITLAGGFTDKAASGRIKIKRLSENEEVTISATLRDPVLPDDVIVVPDSFF